MKKFRDNETNEVVTIDDLVKEFADLKANNQTESTSFEEYVINCMDYNNGTLEEIAQDWAINRMQRSVSNEIACAEIPYEKALEVIQKYNMFGNWTTYEINNRPVDVDEIRELVEQELGLW